MIKTKKKWFSKCGDKKLSARCKILMVLHYRLTRLHDESGLAAKELYEASGVPYGSIGASMGKWCEWEFTKRYLDIYNGKPVFRYCITKRGIDFVEKRIPPEWLARYSQQIRDFKASQGKKEAN